MDTHPPHDEDDLSGLERRLARWQPAAERLDADAMVFAAGRAAGRGGLGRLLWPACSVLLAVQAAGLLGWGLAERAERQALASRLREQPKAPNAAPVPAVLAEAVYSPSPDDYLHLRRMMEQDPSGGLDSLQPDGPPPIGPPPPEPAILTPGQRGGLLEP
jgi:hypothetical protein